MSQSNLETALSYVQALEAGATGQQLDVFFDPDVTQTEFPNRLLPAGATRDLNALHAAAERGRHAVGNQRYEVRNSVAAGDFVVVEVGWSADLLLELGNTKPGGVIRADFAMVLEFRKGRIVTQRNYDCFHEF
jgi:ketosteroid isomerase-like protein